MAGKDPYDILGVGRSASQDEIKRAYRRLAKETHPDRNPGNKSAEQRFKEVQAAYEVLGDEQRRAQFDRFGAGGPTPDFHQWQGGGPHAADNVHIEFGDIGDLSSIFEQFFSRGARAGGGTRTRAAARNRAPGADLHHEISLSFDEAARGTTREVRLSTGNGDRHQERIEFRVPPAVRDGQTIRVRGRGHEGQGGRGDLLIRVRVEPHPLFRRDGLDVLLDLPLTYDEAALGARVSVPTLEGATLVTVPPGTSSGRKLRLRGQGLRDAQGETGDLYAVVQIVAPRDVSQEARQLIERLRDALREQPRSGPYWPK